jgi:hypothetical protein
MVRELVASLLLPATGCSLILDFSDKALPKDANPDAPYTQAECDYKEPNDTAATAAAITPADTGPAAICAATPEDHDFYKFTVPAGTTKVELRISTTYRPGGDLELRLYDRTGTMMLSQSTSFSNDEVITCPSTLSMCPMLAADDYVFEVFPATGSVNSYTIALTLTP